MQIDNVSVRVPRDSYTEQHATHTRQGIYRRSFIDANEAIKYGFPLMPRKMRREIARDKARVSLYRKRNPNGVLK